MDEHIAIIGVFISDASSVTLVNDLLHEYGQYIKGRMGLPYQEKNVSIISLIVNASGDTISSLSGKIGRIKGVSVKSMVSKI